MSTIHSAKGQEWKSVFVLNCVDGCIPSDLATGSSDEIEEERRLLYVAMTRARDELTLVVPQRFYVHGQPRNGDRHVLASRTRFIPPDLLKHFERVAWPPPALKAARVAREGPAVDLRRGCGRCGGSSDLVLGGREKPCCAFYGAPAFRLAGSNSPGSAEAVRMIFSGQEEFKRLYKPGRAIRIGML